MFDCPLQQKELHINMKSERPGLVQDLCVTQNGQTVVMYRTLRAWS